ncbi:MAG: transglycosylase domain-containing protein, partial [Actinomycetota bacterium]
MIAACALVLVAGACGPLQELEKLPELSAADLRFKPPQSSRIYASDGSVITTLHRTENRTVIPFEMIPPHVRRSVVAIEDVRFFEHDGVDLRAIVRAAVENAASGQIEEGGSTITQQYVKNVIISPGETPARTLGRKIDEAALARQIEQELPKRRILGRYLNTVYFGNGAWGIQTAAKTYFAKPAAELTLAEGALLAGLIRSPSTYDPYERPRSARARRDLVLDKLLEQKWADPQDVARARRRKPSLAPARNRTTYEAPYFVDYVQRLIKYDPRFEFLGATVDERENRLFAGGLEIHTTVDLEAQSAAEDAVATILDESDDPHGSLVAIDPANGHVRAMVGGRDYFAKPKEDRFAKLNLALLSEPDLGDSRKCGTTTRARAAPGCGRQAGSAFKSFALASAIEQGIPLSKTYEAQRCMRFAGADAGEDWSPCNYEEAEYGPTSLLEATINSINVVYAQLAFDVGPENVVKLAHEMGINTELVAAPSVVLGTSPVNPLGMASAYGTLAANGKHHPPVAITRINDARGRVVYEAPSRSRQVLEPSVAYITTTALEQVIEEGTGVAANIGRPAAGKTGTAQDYTDAWFAGYTPDLVAAVWVGYPEGKIGMQTYCSGESLCRPTERDVTGGSWPAEIWHQFMLRALSGVPATDFTEPEEGVVTVAIDTRTGCLAGDLTPDEYVEYASFSEGGQPTQECPVESDGVEIPEVVGFSAEEAEDTLLAEGLYASRTYEPSSSHPPGTVIGLEPGAGELAPEGSTITVVVASGQEDEAEVPSVLGQTQGDAQATLTDA